MIINSVEKQKEKIDELAKIKFSLVDVDNIATDKSIFDLAVGKGPYTSVLDSKSDHSVFVRGFNSYVMNLNDIYETSLDNHKLTNLKQELLSGKSAEIFNLEDKEESLSKSISDTKLLMQSISEQINDKNQEIKSIDLKISDLNSKVGIKDKFINNSMLLNGVYAIAFLSFLDSIGKDQLLTARKEDIIFAIDNTEEKIESLKKSSPDFSNSSSNRKNLEYYSKIFKKLGISILKLTKKTLESKKNSIQNQLDENKDKIDKFTLLINELIASLQGIELAKLEKLLYQGSIEELLANKEKIQKVLNKDSQDKNSLKEKLTLKQKILSEVSGELALTKSEKTENEGFLTKFNKKAADLFSEFYFLYRKTKIKGQEIIKLEKEIIKENSISCDFFINDKNLGADINF